MSFKESSESEVFSNQDTGTLCLSLGQDEVLLIFVVVIVVIVIIGLRDIT